MGNIEQSILDAIEIVTQKELSELNLDKTIRATIKETIDADSHKYKVTYQNANFTAYNITTEEMEIGDIVFVLVPQHDFSKDCFIIANMSTVLNKRETKIETIEEEIADSGVYWEDMA